MTIKTLPTLRTDIATVIYTNTTRDVSEQDIQDSFIDVIDSLESLLGSVTSQAAAPNAGDKEGVYRVTGTTPNQFWVSDGVNVEQIQSESKVSRGAALPDPSTTQFLIFLHDVSASQVDVYYLKDASTWELFTSGAGGGGRVTTTDETGVLVVDETTAGIRKINPNLTVATINPVANGAIDYDLDASQSFIVNTNGNNTLSAPSNLPDAGDMRWAMITVSKTGATDSIAVDAFYNPGTIDISAGAAGDEFAVSVSIMAGKGRITGVRHIT